MLTSKRISYLVHSSRPQLPSIGTLIAVLAAVGCGADGAELTASDGAALGSLEQAFGEDTCGTTTADAVLTENVTYITPAGYDHPECRSSAVLDAPQLATLGDIVTVSWVDPTSAGEKTCSRQSLRASYMLEAGADRGFKEVERAESRGEWLKGTCFMAPLRFQGTTDIIPGPPGVVIDPAQNFGARIVVSGTTNPLLKVGFTRAVSVVYNSGFPRGKE